MIVNWLVRRYPRLTLALLLVDELGALVILRDVWRASGLTWADLFALTGLIMAFMAYTLEDVMKAWDYSRTVAWLRKYRRART